ncbi:MAG: hypothetical protein WAV54_13815 [Acidimicrobiales bacterium]
MSRTVSWVPQHKQGPCESLSTFARRAVLLIYRTGLGGAARHAAGPAEPTLPVLGQVTALVGGAEGALARSAGSRHVLTI